MCRDCFDPRGDDQLPVAVEFLGGRYPFDRREPRRGKFVVNEPLARELFENGQVAFQYVDAEGRVTAEAPYNPNGSYYAIEGIVSRDGQILGKMGHTERYGENLFKNIAGEKVQDIFTNAVNYFRKTK